MKPLAVVGIGFVIGSGCDSHGRDPGEPCWWLPTTSGQMRAVCGGRVQQARREYLAGGRDNNGYRRHPNRHPMKVTKRQETNR